MNNWSQVTLGDIGRGLARYRPVIVVLVGVLLITAFLPGARRDSVTTNAFAPTTGGVVRDDDGLSAPAGARGSNAVAGSTGTVTTGGAGRGSSGAGGTVSRPTGSGAVTGPAAAAGQDLVANCDPATGRIAVPSLYAPPCVAAHDGADPGATHRGVSSDTIKIVWYEVRTDAATTSVLAAAGANDSTELQRQQVLDWIEYYSSHYELWGRKVEIEFLPASGETTDDAAARADAIRAAEEMGAFAVMNAPTSNVFVDELVARGVMCFCTVSQPIEAYLGWAPFVWSNLASSTQLYKHRAKYVSRLAGGPAEHANDPVLTETERVFGLLYYDTDGQAYRPGIDYFIEELRNTYGIELAAVSEYHGYPETARSQEDARPAIQRLVNADVTSVICVCDPFGPIFMTQEATRQLFFPEWIITGSALTDTSFFARLYDPQQWNASFGLSALPARLPEQLGDSYRLLLWHFGREPTAPSSYGVLRGPLDLFFSGIHMAGPRLDPGTFRDGMWAMPPTAMDGITNVGQSFGRHGLWPWDDYLAFDNMTEIWWDPDARGEDELGTDGDGLYRYVDGGVRYLWDQWPDSRPRVFDPENTVTVYDEPPPPDRWPEYPSPSSG